MQGVGQPPAGEDRIGRIVLADGQQGALDAGAVLGGLGGVGPAGRVLVFDGRPVGQHLAVGHLLAHRHRDGDVDGPAAAGQGYLASAQVVPDEDPACEAGLGRRGAAGLVEHVGGQLVGDDDAGGRDRAGIGDAHRVGQRVTGLDGVLPICFGDGDGGRLDGGGQGGGQGGEVGPAALVDAKVGMVDQEGLVCQVSAGAIYVDGEGERARGAGLAGRGNAVDVPVNQVGRIAGRRDDGADVGVDRVPEPDVLQRQAAGVGVAQGVGQELVLLHRRECGFLGEG